MPRHLKILIFTCVLLIVFLTNMQVYRNYQVYKSNETNTECSTVIKLISVEQKRQKVIYTYSIKTSTGDTAAYITFKRKTVGQKVCL